MERLRATYLGHSVYNAGFPHFPRNFSRDSIITGLLTNSEEVLRGQLSLSSDLQGKSADPVTGEEPGKIHHEYPEVYLGSRSTLYCACDTTALYLIGMEAYLNLTGDSGFVETHVENIERAVHYITAHIGEDSLFWETPTFCGAEQFALRVTYWKDSQLPHERQQPSYPIAYTLAHVQNSRALRSAAVLLKRPDLSVLAQKMVDAACGRLWDASEGTFLVAIDQDGPVAARSSDVLHALAYFSPNTFPRERAMHLENSARPLETLCGYRSIPADLQVQDPYHGGSAVWVFEQALIHIGAGKFGLLHAQQVSLRVRHHLDTDPEILGLVADGTTVRIGCDPQLWTIAAKRYFDERVAPVF
jgi:glycogen debranching enzyme